MTEGEIRKLYSDENVMFTLPAFEEMGKDLKRLRNYRNTLKKLKNRLSYQASEASSRGYIPATFDSMMLDFGNRV